MPAALFGILVSALNTLLGFLVRSILVKFVTFFALLFIVKEFMVVATAWGLFPSSGKSIALSNSLVSLPSSVWYFLDLCSASTGIATIVSAYATRFIIRRIPLIG
ncbi:DUF2523 family protein [Undibacterium sp. Ji50W]|uniref:DUF2523 family protein n=1 Tax=Undibacterium sp. Ji50W TaxID=3413041 RepID=UPI003BF3F827